MGTKHSIARMKSPAGGWRSESTHAVKGAPQAVIGLPEAARDGLTHSPRNLLREILRVEHLAELGPVGDAAALRLVDILADHDVAVLLGMVAQGAQLGGDGEVDVLAVAGDAGVEGGGVGVGSLLGHRWFSLLDRGSYTWYRTLSHSCLLPVEADQVIALDSIR